MKAHRHEYRHNITITFVTHNVTIIKNNIVMSHFLSFFFFFYFLQNIEDEIFFFFFFILVVLHFFRLRDHSLSMYLYTYNILRMRIYYRVFLVY